MPKLPEFPTLDPEKVAAAEEEAERGGTGTPAAEVFARLLAECGGSE